MHAVYVSCGATGLRCSGSVRPDFFLLVDLRDFLSDLGSGGQKKQEKKLMKPPVDWSFSELFFF